MTARILPISIVCLAVFEIAAAQTTFKYASITFPGASATSANGINNSGEIVGAFTTTANCTPTFYPVANCTTHGFTDVNGTFSQIDVTGAMNTVVNGVNDLGDLVGTYMSSDGNVHGFLLSHNGTLQTLDDPNAPSGLTTIPMGINRSGAVAGMLYTIFGQNPNNGFLWSAGTFTQSSVSFDGGYRGIANNGTIVGQVFLRDFWNGYFDQANDQDAFLLKFDTFTTGVNNHSDIVGYTGSSAYFAANVEANEGTGDTETRPKFVPIVPPGAQSTIANDVNDNDAIVGSYVSSNCQCGFLAVPSK